MNKNNYGYNISNDNRIPKSYNKQSVSLNDNVRL